MKNTLQYLTRLFILLAPIFLLVIICSTPAMCQSGLQFNGTNQYLTFGQATSTLGSQTFTLECWFKRTGTGTTGTTGTGGIVNTAIPILTKGRNEVDGDNRDMNYWMGIDNATSQLAADFEDMASGANHPVRGTTVLLNNVWYHAAVTYNGSTWKVYLNGNLETTLAVGSFTPRGDGIQHAGLGSALNSTATAAGFFAGVIDEVRIWNIERTITQIQGSMNSEVISGTGLIGRWGLNDGSGTTAANSIAGSPSGTLTNGPTWVTGAPGIIPPVTIPSAPTALTVTPVSPFQINLGWTDNSVDETDFEIERSTTGTGGSYSLLATVAANTISYSNISLNANSQYCYRVRAINTVGASGYAGPVCSTTFTEGDYALNLGSAGAYVSFGQAPGLSTQNFTVETWFRKTGNGTANTTGSGGISIIPLLTKGSPQAEASNVDANYILGILSGTNVLAADFEEGTGSSSPGLNHPLSGTTVITNNVWHHAAATFQTGIFSIYLDGILEGTINLTTSVWPQGASIQHAALGTMITSTGTAAGRFQGILDETRIWNYGRTLSELHSTINAQITSSQTGLLGRWGLNDVTGTNVNGSAGTSFTGTIIGSGSSWVTPGAPFNMNIGNQPGAPILNSPPNAGNSSSTSPNLCVTVSDADGDNLQVQFYGRQKIGTSGSKFSIIGLPDTQFYTEQPQGGQNGSGGGHNGIFKAQTQWIADHQTDSNIVFVSQLGDCVQNGDAYLSEWQRADTSFKIIEPPNVPVDGVPYGICVGNHDQGTIGDPDGFTTYYNQFFGETRFNGRGYYGGHFGSNNDNHYQLFSGGGIDFINISIEYYANGTTASLQPVLDWADALMKTHSNRKAIVSSHNILGTGNPGNFQGPGQKIYDELKDNPNFFLMLAGHVPGEGRRMDVFNNDTVYTLMSDYQSGYTNGGNGYLRIMSFYPDQNIINVKTYSPYSNTFFTGSSSQFTLPVSLNSSQPFTLLGTNSNVNSGNSTCIQWPSLTSGEEYEWYVVVSDGEYSTTGPIWTFTATGSVPIEITTEPLDQNKCAGDQASFFSEATGDPTPTIQWQVSTNNSPNWSDVSGATNPTLTFTVNASDNEKQYRAIWTNVSGKDTTVEVSLTVNIVDDNDLCTTDACDSSTGLVTHTAINYDDGNACTSDGCNSTTGSTHTLNPIEDDGNICTTDGCNSLTGPTHVLNSVEDDGNACTTDGCNSLTGPTHDLNPIEDDGNICTTDGCNSLTGPTHVLNSVEDDGNACTTDGCNFITGPTHVLNPIEDDGNICTTDGCNSITGPTHVLNPIEDDGNICTTDGCNSLTGPTHVLNSVEDDGNACTTDGCNSLTGPTHDLNPIEDDGNICTTDGCNSLTGPTHDLNPIEDDGNICTTDGCNSLTGPTHVLNSVEDDGNACTTDGCNSLTGPTHVLNPIEDDGNICTTDGCNSLTGPTHVLNSVEDDGNACTTDGCNSLTGPTQDLNPIEDDGNICTTDGCNSLTGPTHVLNSVEDDGNACTTDGCNSLTGPTHDLNPIEDDGNICTTDGCNSLTGPTHVLNSVEDDGNACTTDGCNSLTGPTHDLNPIEDDGNICTTDGCNSITGPTHDLNPIEDDGNVCTADGCNSITGASHDLNPTEDDGNVCTTDGCNSITGPSHDLNPTEDDGNVCTTDGCNSITGASHDLNPTEDDGNVCTTDGCNSITGPTHDLNPMEDDGNACTTDGCNSITGPMHDLNPIEDDGNVCTTDGCNSITGASHDLNPTEDDGNVCTTDGCNSITGPTYILNPIEDDGNACTTDGCNSLTGPTHVLNPIVDDSNACTLDGCDSVTGVFHIQSCGVTFNSNIFLQGYYSGSGLMAVSGSGFMNATGISPDPTDVDTIEIYAMNSATPYAEVDHQKGILKTNGNVSVTFSNAVVVGNSYYIKINHHNSIETWSAAPVLFSSNTTYNFSTAATQAFFSNMIATPDNLHWAIYNGDLNRDGSVEGGDYLALDPLVQNGDGGYLKEDLNGDGQIDGSDFQVMDPNIQNGVGGAFPIP